MSERYFEPEEIMRLIDRETLSETGHASFDVSEFADELRQIEEESRLDSKYKSLLAEVGPNHPKTIRARLDLLGYAGSGDLDTIWDFIGNDLPLLVRCTDIASDQHVLFNLLCLAGRIIRTPNMGQALDFRSLAFIDFTLELTERHDALNREDSTLLNFLMSLSKDCLDWRQYVLADRVLQIALSCCADQSDSNPKFRDLLWHMGSSAEAKGDLPKAKEYFIRAWRANPKKNSILRSRMEALHPIIRGELESHETFDGKRLHGEKSASDTSTPH